MTVRRFIKEGEPYVWLTFSALVLCLLMVGGMVALVLTQGLATFWPRPLVQVKTGAGETILAQRVDTEENLNGEVIRQQLRIGNRDVYGLDFRWVDVADVTFGDTPPDALVVERLQWGPLFGYVERIEEGDKVLGSGADEGRQVLMEVLPSARERLHHLRRLELAISDQNTLLEALDRERKISLWELKGAPLPEAQLSRLEQEATTIRAKIEVIQKELEQAREEDQLHTVTFTLASGETKELLLSEVVRADAVNRVGWGGRVQIYGERLWEFLSAEPRESNTEGGVWPALFGTVLMTLVMTVFVVPLGVLAAIFLREYARQGLLVSLVRIAVNNLAGVPSIVFGVFGLGFFVYTMGGWVDHTFFPAFLPTPTFGTGGLVWASATLALLTLPVVIVSTEEALAAVPNSVREGAIGCGATQFQALWRVVLPSAAPGLLTGMILAVARGAGEVAPLMLTGVVKLAPALPLDTHAPYLHLERKFMHLGFHIYDVGFQSPNVEAAMPMVYSTTLLLLVLVITLNLTAMLVRSWLREKYRSATF